MIKSAENDAACSRMLRFARAEDGAVAIEFSILTPLLAVLLLFTVEASSATWTRTAVEESAAALADITTQFSEIDDAGVRTVFEAAREILMLEGRGGDVEMTLSSVLSCPCETDADRFCFSVIWSEGYTYGGGGGAMAAGRPTGSEVLDLPQELGNPNGTVVIGEVAYSYQPPLSFALFDGNVLDLTARVDFLPRVSREVLHVGSQASSRRAVCE
ncbi:MAG: TadE/TadG family type IV pilus assembly protein [Pseudomonadota bacterium]